MSTSGRYIALVGEDWAQILGQEKAKYLPRKVGIILHGGGEIKDTLRTMQVMSGNADMAMLPLTEIVDCLIENLEGFSKYNHRYLGALNALKEARISILLADKEMRFVRTGKLRKET